MKTACVGTAPTHLLDGSVMSGKPIICVDFDGCIHSYERGWQDGVIYGSLVPGFLGWAVSALPHFRLVVYSSRSKTGEGRVAMQQWLYNQLRARLMPSEADRFLGQLEFAHEKPPAFLTIDDRAICFRGDWGDPALMPAGLLDFKSWVSRPPGEPV